MTSSISIRKAYARKNLDLGITKISQYQIKSKSTGSILSTHVTFAYQKSCPKHDDFILVDRAISPCNGKITIYVGWITNTEGFNKFHQLPKLRESPKSPGSLSHILLSSRLFTISKVTGPSHRGWVKCQIIRVKIRRILRSAFRHRIKVRELF